MKQVIYDDPVKMLAWAAGRIGIGSFSRDARPIGLKQGDDIIAVVVFDNFSDASSCISVASNGSRKWLNRSFLVRVFAYPFLQLGHRRVTAMITESNAASRRFCSHCGFIEEGRIREDGKDGEDLIVMGMLRRECRFLAAAPAGNFDHIAI